MAAAAVAFAAAATAALLLLMNEAVMSRRSVHAADYVRTYVERMKRDDDEALVNKRNRDCYSWSPKGEYVQ
jgi:hypothetical protein